MHLYEADGQLIYSAGDLTGFLACRHLTQLDLLVTQEELDKPHRHDPLLDVIEERGREHEQRHLENLKDQGLEVVEVGEPERAPDTLRRHEAETLEAMRDAADVIFQATFFDGKWRGHADFLMKVDEPSDLGAHSYEVADTKLARSAKAAAVLQICHYSEHVARLQGMIPRHAHLVLGDRSAPSFKLSDYVTYYRAVKRAFLSTIGTSPQETYPDPVEHCRVCSWLPRCMGERRRDRHLTFVADIRKDQIKKLAAAGIPTIDDLAASDLEREVKGISTSNFARLQDQAALQLEREKTGRHRYKLLEPPGEGLGLEALPEASEADIFFDIEHAEYTGEEGGLEYLFGWVDAVGGGAFTARWAHERGAEKQMYEEFIDLVLQRFRSHPDMHVYHFGVYEGGALKRLEGRYGTREQELDTLLRAKVLVDVHRIVKQSMRISEESYSIKQLEVFYDFERSDDITEAGSSMVEYDRWLRSRDDSILYAIQIYNESDCRSLLALRDWLEERRSEAEGRFGELSRPPLLDGAQDPGAAEDFDEVAQLVERLTADVPEEPAERSPEQQARWLLAHCLGWHRREAKSDWWAYFERQKNTAVELLDDRDTLAVLVFEEVDGEDKQSDLLRYSFPDQETKLAPGDAVVDAHTGAGMGKIWDVDFQRRKVWLRRGKKRDDEAHPEAVAPGPPPSTPAQQAAVRRIAQSVLTEGVRGSRYRAAMQLLVRGAPRFSGRWAGEPLIARGEAAVGAARRLACDLNESCLPIQGPPGTGKTYTGALMILDLVRSGKRVGITANSHKVIANLLTAVGKAAEEEGVEASAIQKCSGAEKCPMDFVKGEAGNPRFEAGVLGGDYQIAAGTAWAMSREAVDGALDVLFVDEAGQFSLANTLAVATCAKNVVLLGDPQQLDQPTKGMHPEGVDASALGHVLGDAETIPPERGLFLEHTFRMHPALTRYVSDAFYDGRLESQEGRDLQVVEEGAPPGIHLLPVRHHGNRIFSWEEADAIAGLTEELIGKTWTDPDGKDGAIAPSDLIVVAPFNAQVSRIRSRVPEGVPVGTVDKFQGQQGVVAIYSITTSSPEDIPRNFEFLYSRNRLNVAVSRAKSYSVVVCNPEMLLPMCRKPEHMRLANALCLLAEYADEVSSSR